LKNYFILFCLAPNVVSCISYDTSLQLAKTLPVGESSTTISSNFSLEHDESVFSERMLASFDTDYNKVLPRSGMSFAKRWGLDESSDWGFSLSLKESSLGLKYNYLNISDLSLATSLKVLVDILGFDLLQNYAFKFEAINSYEILDNLNIYVTPSFIYHPVGKDQWNYLESSFGIVLGKDYGIALEWSHRSPVNVDFSSSLEQLSIAFLTNINPKKPYKENKNIKDRLFSAAGEFSFGLSQSVLGGLCFLFSPWDKNNLELAFDFGVGRTPIQYRENDRHGWRSYYSSRLSYRGYFGESLFSYIVGLKYKKEQLNMHLTQGWHRFVSKSLGFEMSMGYRFQDVQIDPIVLYVPIPFLYQYSTVENTSGLVVFEKDKNNSYAKKASKRIDIAFFRTQLFL
jgi:hypothetical protein